MKTGHFVVWLVIALVVLFGGSFLAALLLSGPPPDGAVSYSLANEAWEVAVLVKTGEILFVGIMIAMATMILMAIILMAIIMFATSKPEEDFYPHLLRCGVSGVTALCRAESFDRAEPRHTFSRDGRLNLRVVPRTMTFSKFRLRNMTGTMEDMARLTEGCVVEDRLFFVPHASDIFMSYEEQEQEFPFVRLDEAYDLIWDGRRRQMPATSAA